MARWVDSRPTPIATGASSAAPSASRTNQAETTPWGGAERGERLGGRALEHLGVVEDRAEPGEGQVHEHGGGDHRRGGTAGGHG
jgi:hypothetical protein